ncbi:uncharacterized protein LOC119730417 [Patiria miniata]|uniref:Centromere protein Q n=1 Tax=Patiria miniata TaxID=46514 RepID=A0A914A5T3_PATMI|nr:uncharacterized protein LOC119730417 [Patiria miniata]XP_038059223.1 uncharacterized protein LOC119730417 [Patiria miniata]
MPRTAKTKTAAAKPQAKTKAKTKTKTSNAAAKPQAKKGSTSGRKQSKKSSADVAEMLKTLNQKTSDTSSQQSSSGPVTRPTSRGQKTKAPRGSDSTTSPRQGQTTARGGRGRGARSRRGVAERTQDAADDLQEDVRTNRGTAVKRQQKMRGKNQEAIPVASREVSPTKRRRQTDLRNMLDDDDYLERQVSAQSIAKWQTMTKTSQEFLNQIADGAINVILNETSGPAHNDIQDHLNNLKTRLMKSFVSLKVPNRRQPNYREMEKQARILEAGLVETSNQVECLDKEVQLQQELLEQKEEELDKLEAAEHQDHHDNDTENMKKLNPLLQDTRQDVLGLPPLRKSRHGNTSAQFEDVRSSCQQQVVESLRHWSQTQGEGGVVEMTEFLDAVSAVQAALPQ